MTKQRRLVFRLLGFGILIGTILIAPSLTSLPILVVLVGVVAFIACNAYASGFFAGKTPPAE